MAHSPRYKHLRSLRPPHAEIVDSRARQILMEYYEVLQYIVHNWPKTAEAAEEVAATGGSGGGIGEAPVDGNQYARQDGAWSQVVSGSDFSWRFLQTSDTAGTVTLGLVFLSGVLKTVASWPSGGNLTGITTSIKYWVAIDVSVATATWASGSSYPDGTDTLEIWPILEVTCDGSIITSFIQRQCSDIHITRFS